MNATHFIEIIKYPDGEIKAMSLVPIKDLNWSLRVSAKHNYQTIALLKVQRKPEPMIAHYDFNNKVTIVD